MSAARRRGRFRPATRKRTLENERAVASVDDFAGPVSTKKKKTRPPTKEIIDRWRNEARGMVREKDWTEAHAGHLVALYAEMHAIVYGVEPLELKGRVYQGAMSAARKLLRDEFDGEFVRVVAFLRWTWHEERRTEKWRRDEGRPGGVIGWRKQFQNRELVTKYRIIRARRSP